MDRLSLMMYIEIDILCIILMLWIGYKSFRFIEKRESWYYLRRVIISNTIFIVLDLWWIFMENNLLPSSSSVQYMVSALYYLCSIAATAGWYCYTECELNTKFFKSRGMIVLTSLPVVAMVYLLVYGAFNNILFYFDANGTFHRGPLNILCFAIPCFYLVLAVVRSVLLAFKKENYANRSSYLNLAYFALWPTVTSAAQIFFQGTPLPCIGMSVGMLMVYINSKELLVSIDPLTKMNNRSQMIRHLSDKMNHATEHTFLYLLLIDLDKFKSINDTYGHVEGDNALIRTSDVLKSAATAFNCFAARYGGDEFILIFETTREKDIEDLCWYIQTRLAESNKKASTDYKIEASIGYAKYTKSIQYIPEFIEQADKFLYLQKQKKRSGVICS